MSTTPPTADVELDRGALVEADLAYVREPPGTPSAERVRAAITAYLAAARRDAPQPSGPEPTWPACRKFPNLGCTCRGAMMANPTSGTCIRERTGDLTPIAARTQPSAPVQTAVEAWDRCVREVAGVDPRAIHNPYRDGDDR